MMHARQLGVRSLVWVSGFFFTLLLVLGWPSSPSADQAQYFYDELGRLVGAVDGQGNIATYEYDQVGNLLSVTRGATTAPMITTISPNPSEAGGVTPITLTGSGLQFGTVTTSNPDILISVLSDNTETLLESIFTIPNPTFFGATTVTVTGPGGSVDTTLTVVQPVPTITQLSPSIGLVGSTVEVTGTGFGTTPGSNHVTFATGAGGRIEATVLGEDFTNVSVEVPVGAVSGEVTVEVGSLTSGGMAFEVVDPATIPVTATIGIPTNTAEPSVNSGQVVQLQGAGFVAGATGTIPTLDATGVIGQAVVPLTNVSGDGMTATITVPATATSGAWGFSGSTLDGVQVQVVPTLLALQGTAIEGNPLDLAGSGFQEGGTTVFFPGNLVGVAATDVSGNNDLVSVSVPSGLAGGFVTVRTIGGTSNGISVGLPALLDIFDMTAAGTPTDPSLPFTDGSVIRLLGLELVNGLPVELPATTASGVPALVIRNTFLASANGTTARVTLSGGVTTGNVRLGTNVVPLQIVPRIIDFTLLPLGSAFGPGTTVNVRGRGFKEGATMVTFTGGGAPISTVDVFETNTQLTVAIPSGVTLVPPGTSTELTVATDGGISLPLSISHPLLAGVPTTADRGTPQNPLQPSVNINQFVTMQGTAFTENTRAVMSAFSPSGTIFNLSSFSDTISPDGTSLTVTFNGGVFTSPLTVQDSNLKMGSGSVPMQIVPTIRNIVGTVTEGAQIEIQGFGFDPNSTEVLFPGVVTPVAVEATSVVSSGGREGTVTVPVGVDPAGSVTIVTPGGSSDPFDLELLTAGDAEIEPNNTSATATWLLFGITQPTRSVTKVGTINPVGDVDYYRFDDDFQGGGPYFGALYLDTPTSPSLTLRATWLDKDGTVLLTTEGVVNSVGPPDPFGDPVPGVLSFEFIPPTTGKYFLKIEETTGQGSAAHMYRLDLTLEGDELPG